MDIAKNYVLTNEDGNDVTHELLSFADCIGLNSVAPNRYSLIFLLELYGGFKSGGIHVEKVLHEIRVLEGTGQQSQLKEPTQFLRPPLKGLWHKHYFEGGLGALAFNLRKALNRYGIPFFEQKINEAKEPGGRQSISIDDPDVNEWINDLVNDVVSGHWTRLTDDQAVTGEWIVYATHENQNFYLCLGRHDDGDEVIRTKIDSQCLQQFPFLENILE